MSGGTSELGGRGAPRPARTALPVLLSVALLGAGGAGAPAPVVFDVPGHSDATPWIAAAGPVVAVAWGAAAAGKADVFVAVSRNGGETFGPPVKVNRIDGEARLGGELPPRVALSSIAPGSLPEVVVLWTTRSDSTEIKSARSRDAGRTFEAPVMLQGAGAAGDRGWPALALDRQGVAHAVWLDHRGLAARRGAAAHADHHDATPHDGVAMAQASALYYSSSAPSTPAERAVTTGVCYCCKTALAVAADGALYAAWRHVYPGNLRDIALAVSRDGGRSFSSPARVSEDGWSIDGCPDDGPAMAVDASSTVHIVWPTVVSREPLEGALFYASTRDGRHFTPRVRIPTLGSPRPSHPQIAVDANSRIVVAWDERIDGRRVAAMRQVMPSPAAAPHFGEVVTISSGSAMYPVLAATDAGFVAAWATGGDPSRVEVRTVSLP